MNKIEKRASGAQTNRSIVGFPVGAVAKAQGEAVGREAEQAEHNRASCCAILALGKTYIMIGVFTSVGRAMTRECQRAVRTSARMQRCRIKNQN